MLKIYNMYNRIMTNEYINKYNLLRYNNDPNFRQKKLENNKKYYYNKKYKITILHITKTINFN